MGLAERRATKEFQDKNLPSLREELEKLLGKPFELEINWEQLAKEKYAEKLAENWRKVYFQPVINALKAIARDEMGKDAVRDGLRKITFCNTRGGWATSTAISFTGGELMIDHDPCSNVDYIDERAKFIIKTVEKAL